MGILLDKARSYKTNKRKYSAPSFDEIELACSYFDGSITESQITHALDLNNTSSARTFLLRVIRMAVRNDLLELKINGIASKILKVG